MLERRSLDTLCAALAYAMKIDAPECAAEANPTLVKFIDEKFGSAGADRIFMYNPDAVAQWIMEKYSFLLRDVRERAEITLEFETVMPSVTPVCPMAPV